MDALIWILLIVSGVLATWLFHAMKDLWKTQGELNQANALSHERAKEIEALKVLRLQNERQIKSLTQYASNEAKRHLTFMQNAFDFNSRLISRVTELEGEKRVLENTIKHQFRTYFDPKNDGPKQAA